MLYSWLLRCDCCQNWQMCFTTQMNCTHNKTVLLENVFIIDCFCVNTFFVFFNFEFILVFGKKKKEKKCCHLFFCHFKFFRIWLLLKIPWFGNVTVLYVWCLFLLFLPLFNTWGWLGWLKSWIERWRKVIDFHWLDLKIYWSSCKVPPLSLVTHTLQSWNTTFPVLFPPLSFPGLLVLFQLWYICVLCDNRAGIEVAILWIKVGLYWSCASKSLWFIPASWLAAVNLLPW